MLFSCDPGMNWTSEAQKSRAGSIPVSAAEKISKLCCISMVRDSSLPHLHPFNRWSSTHCFLFHSSFFPHVHLKWFLVFLFWVAHLHLWLMRVFSECLNVTRTPSNQKPDMCSDCEKSATATTTRSSWLIVFEICKLYGFIFTLMAVKLD